MPASLPLSSLFAGLGLGLSLIVAIGAQNVFVLRQGIRREHVFAVAAICALSDLVLIVVGVSGIGAVLTAVPWLVDAIRWAGAAFLVGYGVLAARRAWHPSGEGLVASDRAEASEAPETSAPSLPVAIQEELSGARRVARDTPTATAEVPESRNGAPGLLGVALTCLALTWLNPHVYLDTVFLLGSVANTHGDPGRWAFAVGAGAASILWFFGLAYGARWLGRWLATPRAWRVLDAVIAVVMIALGVSLVVPH
ncbi:LysE/ArgO family amino acid transporter [Agromyces larvae]|uniref:LysE/ArgO family amino acid transporter n=1 Tax=Agromyces larvae TaxID=2929802 RepID=A0ABY4C572_9MICO|nr:LysE/ArgO family amino acid transporter [Agromyces larvae]UOE43900.1 LysE/ArgO family amino acid transporter [Agromyces larvae]